MVIVGASLKLDRFVEVDWTDSTIVCVDDEGSSEPESDINGFAVNIPQCQFAVTTGTLSLCDFRDIVPKYVLYKCLRLDC